MSQAPVGVPWTPDQDTSEIRRSPLSKQIWGLDWREILPWQFDETEVVSGTLADAMPFIAEHYGKIFGAADQQVRFFHEPMTDAKRRFTEMSDVFLFRAEGRPFGVMIAHPTDWSTYYVRTTAFLPEQRNRHIMTRFVQRIYEPLIAAGVSRMEADTAPSNLAVQKILHGLEWMVTGTTNSERWGLMLRQTKLFREDAKSAFLQQFCVTPR